MGCYASHRHCEERSDAAIQTLPLFSSAALLDCFTSFAMTKWAYAYFVWGILHSVQNDKRTQKKRRCCAV
ncbi:MAG: hypothetical protein K2N22_07215 [Clostridia bacterium]|nr:hypothetical protein [Clostridia bacterium]